MSELACRGCGRAGAMTVIYGNDGTGALAPVSAVCRGGCPDGRVRTTTRAVTTTAARPGICFACGNEIVPPQPVTRTRVGHVHRECAVA